ncbi:MAG: hypothetical protein ACFB6R_00370 [Alphaproteobacteria bacterium]
MVRKAWLGAFTVLCLAIGAVFGGAGEATGEALAAGPLDIAVGIADGLQDGPVDGRVIVILATSDEAEPRFQTSWRYTGPQIFGVGVGGFKTGDKAVVTTKTFGFPTASLADLPAGDYVVQAVLHKYETFTLGNGKTVKLPMNRGAGQNWRRAPGNLFSTPKTVTYDPAKGGRLDIVLDQVNPPIEAPADTTYVRHIRMKSDLLSAFWGRDIYLGAHVLVPKGFDVRKDARYPLAIFHGHFPADFDGFRTEPPAEDLECRDSERFQVACYNRIQQQEAYDFYKKWSGPDFPRMLIVKIQHANPYYDDSYAVNSANLGPYGDAITKELVPFIEKQFRGIGEPWARFLYGGSTGGWEAMAAQVFYPDDYNGAFIACPDPIDFRAYTLVNIYEDKNAYYMDGPFKRFHRVGHRDYLGQVRSTLEMMNHYELVLGTKNRSGDQWDIWEAVYSPMGEDGYPKRLWNKRTGEIDPAVAAHWRENYDLRHILERDWQTLGPKLQGKLHIYVGDMDNYYLNNAVYLTEAFLEQADPPYKGEVLYGDRAEHCWNGDFENPNHISRLRYNTQYLPKILKRIEETAPKGADLTSWRY